MNAARSASVSLCMIVRNEGHQLADCLAPIAALFDEIVIVDTGSHDDSRQVAQRFATRVVDFPWCDDFSAARNVALAHAGGEWIFWLDADDRVSAANVERLKQLFAQLGQRPQAFLMQTLLNLDEESRDRQRVATHLRLFQRHPDLRWHRRVHEQLMPWPALLGHDVVFTNIQIEHLGYRDPQLSQRKLRRNLRLLNMEYALAPDDPSVLMDLGYAHAQLGKIAEARSYLQAVLRDARPLPFLRRRAFTTLGELETAAGNFSRAAELLSHALAEIPGDEYLLYMYAEALYNLGRHAEAKIALVEILQRPDTFEAYFAGGPVDIRQRLARLALGEVLRVDSALPEAESVLMGVTDDFPADPTAWYFVGRVYIDWRDWNKLGVVISKLAHCPTGAVYAQLLTASSQLARRRYLETEQTIDALIAEVPYMIMPRVLRAESLFARQAPHAAKVQACRDVLRLQPVNSRALELLEQLENEATPHASLAAANLCTSVVLGAGLPVGGLATA